MNDKHKIWLEKVKEFPVVILVAFNLVLVFVVAVQIYFFFKYYVFFLDGNALEFCSDKIVRYVSDGFKKILLTFLFEFLVLIGCNFSCIVFIRKTQSALIYRDE